MHKGIRIIVAIAILALPIAALADAPAFVPVQGFLTDADGTPVDGATVLTLSLYAGPSDPTLLFSEVQTVLVENGFFTVFVGQVETLDLALFKDNGTAVLGIAVGEEAEMVPRLSIGSVPYAGFAQHAGDAATLGGMEPSDFRSAADDVSWDDLADVPTEISDGDSDALGGLTCTGGQLAKWDGTAWACSEDLDTDSLAVLGASCTSGQLPKWDGVAWGCGDDIDTLLTEVDVDIMVANNGYALETDLAAVALSGDFVDLINVPADLLDGDNDSLAALTSCALDQVVKWNDTALAWECGDDVDTDTLAALTTCTLGQVAKYNDTAMAWECADDVNTGYTSEAELTALLDDNYLPSSYLPDWASLQNIPADIADGDDNTQLSEAQVETYIENGPVNLAAGTTLNAQTISTGPHTTSLPWTSITSRPAGLDDGDDNTQLTEVQVETYIVNGSVDLAAGTTLNGATISTGSHTTSLPWNSITGRPSGLDDGDDNTTYSAGAGLVLNGTIFGFPAGTFRSWGSGTQTHYTGTGYVLESTTASNLRIRLTEGGVFYSLGMEYPTACGTPNTIGSVNRFALSIGDTLDATFCNEGSMIFVLVSRNPSSATRPDMFRCWRSFGNANNCQKL